MGSVLLLVLAVALGDVLEASMATHMLVHIPLILFSGMLAHRAWRLVRAPRGCTDREGREGGKGSKDSKDSENSQRSGDSVGGHGGDDAREETRHVGYDEYGIAGLLWASFVGAYWMLPRALDQVLVSSWAHYGKFGVLFVTGLVLSAALRRANSVIKLFFLGSFCWMSAIVGLLYQEYPQRLCNFYLMSDQEWAGRGMVALALILPLFWLYTERPKHKG